MDIKERIQKPDVRAVIDSLFPKPNFGLEAQISAPALNSNYAEIGAAFNYMFTFWLANNHNSPEIVRWPTSTGLQTIENQYPEYYNQANNAIETAEDNFVDFLETGNLTNALAKASLDLARVEAAYNGDRPRAINLLQRLGKASSEDKRDLIALYKTIPHQFSEYDSVTVNPGFGPVGVRVGGVDADIVFDGLLIDSKTTKSLTLNISYWRKMVAYATLANASHQVDETFDSSISSVPEITSVGIYYSRYGVLWEKSTETIYQHKKFNSFREWLMKTLSNN